MKIEDFYKKDRHRICLDGHGDDGYAHLDECIDKCLDADSIYDVFYKRELNEFIEEYDKPIELDSFKPQKELNPDVWINGKINSRVRLQLMDIAYDFIRTLKVDWVEPKDIVLTGSLANYNWSEFSDFDLHIIMDYSEVDERTDFVGEYFRAKKKEWNDNHKDLHIFGFPVEVYVQDEKEEHTASGVYSLYNNNWLKEPDPESIQPIKLDKFFIKEKALKIINKIEDLCDDFECEDDKHRLEVINDKAKALMDKIKAMRKEGLMHSGEMNPYNIVFKVLRRLGFIEKLVDIRTKTYDKINSID